MAFPKDITKRDWDWHSVAGELHMPLTDLRMIRIRMVQDSDGVYSHFTLELLTPKSTKWETIKMRGGNESPVEWLQSYAEYVFQGQQPC